MEVDKLQKPLFLCQITIKRILMSYAEDYRICHLGFKSEVKDVRRKYCSSWKTDHIGIDCAFVQILLSLCARIIFIIYWKNAFIE